MARPKVRIVKKWRHRWGRFITPLYSERSPPMLDEQELRNTLATVRVGVIVHGWAAREVVEHIDRTLSGTLDARNKHFLLLVNSLRELIR